jgi:SPP1 gp7 family putative phage head morphogenesis protein
MEWTDIIDRIAQQLHAGEIEPIDISPEMIQGYANEIMGGFTTGFSNENSIGAIDPKVLKAIKSNVFVFSGFKTHAELVDWSLRLLDDNGNIKPFKTFLNEVYTVNKTYKEHYLKSEYDLALKTGQSIAQYESYVEDTEANPLWRVSVVLDERTRASHAALEGITLPTNDAFWKTHWPPFDWNCRCTIQQISDGEATDLTNLKLPELKPMFRRNPAIKQEVFDIKKQPSAQIVTPRESKEIYKKSLSAMRQNK